MLLARESRGVRTFLTCAVAGGVLGLCGPANAAMTLHIDLNSISVTADGAFDGETHTGGLIVGMDLDSELHRLEIDGVSQSMSAHLVGLDGNVQLENGAVVGGDFLVTLSDGASYAASVGSGAGDVSPQPGQGFMVDGLTGSGAFDELADGKDFGGVDVTPWLDVRGGVDGSFLLFGFGPNASGLDSDVNLELYLVDVPAPGTVVLGSMGMAFANRRKRQLAG